MNWRDAVDRLIEAPIVTSYTRLGPTLRRHLHGWRSLDSYRLEGRVIALTGPTSGIGRAAAEQFAANGATLLLLARDLEKAEKLRDELVMTTGNVDIEAIRVDLSDLASVRDAAARVLAIHARLDALIHNAGALVNERQTSPDGIELTVATQVAGPFLLTTLLLDRLRESAPSRVITMSSGGMYTQRLDTSVLEMPPDGYSGATAYARAKRAQVTLNQLWAKRTRGSGVYFQSMHPGWVDTPGLRDSLPGFRRLIGPLLRDPALGADTMVWLASDDGLPLERSGRFWLDRRPRPIHRLPVTRKSDTPAQRVELWNWCVEQAGEEPPEA